MATTATAISGFVNFGPKTIIRRRRDIVNVPIRNGGFNQISLRKNRLVIEATNNEDSIGAFSSRIDIEQIDEDLDMFRIESLAMNAESYDADNDNRNRSTISSEKLDEWTRGSIEEIIKNIEQAPFMVFVYSSSSADSTDSSGRFRLVTRPVGAQSWKSVTQKWDGIGSSTPDGIILVEELTVDEEEEENCRQSESLQGCKKRIWGVLVQGKGVGCNACYILHTFRVVSSVGASTHFYLVRANCFGDSIELQLKKSWLSR